LGRSRGARTLLNELNNLLDSICSSRTGLLDFGIYERVLSWAHLATISRNTRERRICSARAARMTTSIWPTESLDFIADASLIVEEKLDGTNVGMHFTSAGRMVLQCRGHEITTGMHAQYDLFKQWTMGKRPMLEALLADRFILFGEWLYARHSVHYRAFRTTSSSSNIYDKQRQGFLDLALRLEDLKEVASLRCRSFTAARRPPPTCLN